MRIGKIGGTVATIALVSVFVFGGVEVAHASAPVTLAGFTSSGATNSSLAANNNISGTADPSAPITVTMTNSGSTSTYCTATTDQLGHWICPSGAQVPLGKTTFTASDGTTSAASDPITIYGMDGPSLTSPHPGSSVLPEYTVFSGSGPARGSVSVLANAGGTVCNVALVPDSGQWTCASSSTLPDGSNGFTIVSSTPGFPSDTFYSGTSATVPVTVSELTVPTPSYVIGYATATSTTTSSFENAAMGTDLYSITELGGSGTGYLRSSNPSPSCGPMVAPGPLVCNFGILVAGIWEVHTFHYVGEMTPVARNDFFRIPETPTMTATAQSDQTVAFSGAGTTGDLVSVTTTGGSDGGTTVCTATVADDAWGCTAAATPGAHSYHASQLDQGWTPYPDSGNQANVDGSPLGVVLEGRSALTQTAAVTVVAPPTPPAAPTMSYDFGNASVTITAAGDPAGDGASIDVYSVSDGEGGGYSFTRYPACESSTGENGGSGGFVALAAVTSPPTTQTCTLDNLTPGIWNIFSSQSVNGQPSPFQNDFFRVPNAPTLGAQSSAQNSVTLSGTGVSGDVVTALQDGSAVCQAPVTDGTWSCTITSTAGTHSYTASQLDQGFVITDPKESYGNVYNARSALSSSVVLTLAAAPVAPPATPPAAAPKVTTPQTPTIQTLFFWVLNIVGGDVPLHAGDTVTVSSSGLPAGALVSFELHSTPRLLGTMTIGSDGAFTRTITIPDDVAIGDHHIVVTVTPQGDTPSPHEAAISVVPVPPAALESEASGDSAKSGSTPHGHHPGAGARNDLSAPSSFTQALPTLASLFENPGTLAVAVGLALAIMLLAALPTEILDSAVSSNLDRFGPFLNRAGSWAERATAWLNRVTHGPAAASAVMIVLSALIFGFADPHYGFNLVSLRLTLSIIIGLLVIYYLAPRISGALVRSRWKLESEISIKPIALVFAIIGVVVGRLLGFSPGFLIGLAIGLELAANSRTLHKARSMAVQVAVMVALALAAWVGYSLIALAVGSGEGSALSALVQDALTTVTAEGLTGMLLGLLPLAFFEGKAVWDHSKILWAALFLFTATAFSLLVLPTAIAPQKIGESLPVWVLVLGCFTVLSLGVWLYLKLTASPEQEAVETEPERVDA